MRGPPLPISEADHGLPWNWRIGPAARAVSDASDTALAFTPAGRGLVPFAPVHVAQPWQTAPSPGAPTLTDMGASFAIATGGVLTLFIAAPPNGSSACVRVVGGVSGAVFEQEITTDLLANTQFLSPRLYMNNGATAAAVAYDCSGVYVETDY